MQQLSKQLVLFRYILKQFGFEDFETLRDVMSEKQSGYDSTGRSYFISTFMGIENSIDEHSLLQYDDAIRGYEEKLRDNRTEPFFSLKYYQHLSLLFTEYYFDCLHTNHQVLLHNLNAFKNRNRDFEKLTDFTSKDLKKLAYWMATGSGKTLLMHCNYWQIRKYQKDWENILLITPNEGMSRQHYESLRESGIDAKMYSGSEESLKTKDGEVLIIEITKLVQEKAGEGVSVDVDYFSESKNLVFIDEGHKGQRSEEKKWKSLREYITRGDNSFTIEYSATFGQIITNANKDLLQEYGKAIIFDYSYRHFYADEYGKDFSVFNIDAKDDYSEEQTRLLLTASLMGFYEQLLMFEKHQKELRTYNIEKPLWVFVGSKVIGKNGGLNKGEKVSVSDVTRVISFFDYALSDPGALGRDIEKILGEQSGLLNTKGEDIFTGKFQYLKQHRPAVESILSKVFNGTGSLEGYRIKQEDGEIGLKTQTSTEHRYFGVINIGDVNKYSKKLEEDTDGKIVINEDNFTPSLFHQIDSPSSSVNILIGSKKFIEGWNSWRVSSMGLMNMGKNEGAQIVQLFGRGVRLKGKNFSLKREPANAPYHIRTLQTISIFGLNASYMNHFLENIEKETPDYSEYSIQIQFNNREDWENKIVTFQTEEGHNFRDQTITLELETEILRRVTIDLRTKVSVASGGFNSEVAEDESTYFKNFVHAFIDFIDFNALLLEARRYCQIKGYTNLIIGNSVLEAVLNSSEFRIYSQQGQFGIREAVNGKLQHIATMVIKDYINKFCSDKEKDSLTRNLTFDMLSPDKHPDIFPSDYEMVIKAPKAESETIEKLLENAEQFYQKNITDIPTLHFKNHLYTPLAVWRRGSKYQQIKTIPTKLNEGETNFIEHLKRYLISRSKDLENKEIFLLRNLSRRGVGFFIESSAFFPDFILWIIDGNHQHIFFLDPKGLQYEGNFNADKIVFCTKQITEINDAIRKKIKSDKKSFDISLNAFILSVSGYDAIKRTWGNRDATLQDFTDHNVLFINEDLAYLGKIFERVVK